MGVPVVTLRGSRHAGRVGASLLQQVGLPELITESEQEYVDLVLTLANDEQRLERVRARLRQQMRASDLMNLEKFTRSLEAAYADIWARWCADVVSE